MASESPAALSMTSLTSAHPSEGDLAEVHLEIRWQRAEGFPRTRPRHSRARRQRDDAVVVANEGSNARAIRYAVLRRIPTRLRDALHGPRFSAVYAREIAHVEEQIVGPTAIDRKSVV